MIATMDDLMMYAARQAHETPALAGETLLRRPGLDNVRIAQLEHKLSLPAVYKRCLSDMDLFGISIGFFALWPGSRRRADITEAILADNESENPMAIEARRQGLIVVGREEANFIAVGSATSVCPDRVFWIDATSPVVTTREVAVDFEKFMLLAANLHELSQSQDGGKEVLIAEMKRRCQSLGCSASQAVFWLEQLEMLLG